MSRDRRPMTLGDFIAQMTDYFDAVSRNQVRAAGAPGASKGEAKPAGYPAGPAGFAAPAPAVTVGAGGVMKYADVSRGIQNILNQQASAIRIDELEIVFKEQFGTSIA